jgi:hypothetical protein
MQSRFKRIKFIRTITVGSVLGLLATIPWPIAVAQKAEYRAIEAADRTFTVQIPASWQVEHAEVKRASAQGPRGETVAWGSISVIDRADFFAYQRLLGPQFARYASGVFPVVADPMPPEQVIPEMFPRFNPAVRGIRMLGSRPVATTAAFVVYQYELARSFAPIRGEALVYTNPPKAGGFGIWSIVYWRAEAPAGVFAEMEPVFDSIFRSLHYDSDRIMQLIREVEQRQSQTAAGVIRGEAGEYQRRSQMIDEFGRNMQQMQTTLYDTFQTQSLKSGEGAVESLGGAQKFVDQSGNEFNFNLHQKSHRYNCVNGSGAAAIYYGSDTQNCVEQGAAAGIELTPITRQ